MGEEKKPVTLVIYAMKARKLLESGCQWYLANVVNVSKENSLSPSDVPIVWEFEDMFLEDLLGLSQDQVIEFTMDLMLGTQKISKAPYRIAPVELHELK